MTERERTDLDTLLDAVRYDSNGLVPAIVQDTLTGEVRMFAFMNRESLGLTVETGFVHFYSRSRSALWKKGESSGNTLAIREIFLDCDNDALLVQVEPNGPTCHTGTASCFFRVASREPAGWTEGARPRVFAEQLEATLLARKNSSAEKSYTRKLLDGGVALIGDKVREEADELARALDHETDQRVTSEAADVLYHSLVGLIARGVSWRAVLSELARRFGTSGLAEKASRSSP